MSTGLLTGRRNSSWVLVLAFAVVAFAAVALVALSGCGNGGEEEEAVQQKPRAMVPGGTADTTVVDTASVIVDESAYVAGTLSDPDGVTQDSVAPEKAEPAAGAAKTENRPATSVQSNNGGYSLQLGSFTNLENARNQADRIRALGYAPTIEESNLGGQIYHRVMLSGVGDMAEASRLGEHIHSKLGIAYLVRRGN